MRLQLTDLDRALLAERRAATDFPPSWHSMDALAALADREVDALRRSRRERARGLDQVSAHLDAVVRTDATEWMDRDCLSDAERTRMVQQLHRFNTVLMSYPRFVRMLQPIVRSVHARERRPVRVLELASGAGELTLALDRLARRRRLPMWLTGSDIVQTHVDGANREAAAHDCRARFRRLDAMALADQVESGAYDVIFIAQAAHHFTAGQLAVMIAQARLVGARHFVLIDGRRALSTLMVLPWAVSAFGGRKLIEDAVITARKFYADAELELMARLAAPDARVELRRRAPFFVQLDVRY